MKASTSHQPDLDWSQVRETLTMVALAVVQIKASMTESNESAERLSTAITEISSSLEKIRTSYLQDNHTSAEFDDIETQIQQSVISLQSNDRLNQRLDHVAESLVDLGLIIDDPARLYNPLAWKKLQDEIKESHTMEEERIMFEHIMMGATIPEALEIYRHHFESKPEQDDTGDEIELF